MSHGQCSCPDCGTILRIRDRTFVGREVQCPECQIKLVIRMKDDRGYFAERPKAEANRPTKAVPSLPSLKVYSTLLRRVGEILGSPLVLAWALAIGITAFAAILILRPAVRFKAASMQEAVELVTIDTANRARSSPEAATNVGAQTSRTDPLPVASAAQSLPDAAPPTPDPAPGVPVPVPIVVSEGVDAPHPPLAVTKPERESKPVVVTVPKVDIEDLLQQRLLKFATSQPVTRTQMIEQIEEMVGVPIRYNRDELGEKNLERTIDISLESTTVGGVLKALLEPAGWEFVIEEMGIRLKPRQLAGPMSS